MWAALPDRFFRAMLTKPIRFSRELAATRDARDGPGGSHAGTQDDIEARRLDPGAAVDQSGRQAAAPARCRIAAQHDPYPARRHALRRLPAHEEPQEALHRPRREFPGELRALSR